MPVSVDLGNGFAAAAKKSPYPSESGKIKRKLRDAGADQGTRGKMSEIRNFVLSTFKDPVLFVGHLSEHSLFVVEKSWMQVARTFDAPVHRHIFGT